MCAPKEPKEPKGEFFPPLNTNSTNVNRRGSQRVPSMPRHLQTLQLVAVPPGTPSVPQSPTGYDFLNLNESKFCVKTVRILEKAEPKVLQCEKCERVFTSNSSLDYHIKRKVCEQVKTVMAGPPYVCDICSTSFELRQTWYAHVQRQACKKYPERYMNQDATDLEVNVKIETD